MYLFTASVSESETEGGQLCVQSSHHSRMESVHQQEPSEERAETERSSVSIISDTATFVLCYTVCFGFVALHIAFNA